MSKMSLANHHRYTQDGVASVITCRNNRGAKRGWPSENMQFQTQLIPQTNDNSGRTRRMKNGD